MQERFVESLRSPTSRNQLSLEDAVPGPDGEIKQGRLVDTRSDVSYEIVNYIPRFVRSSSYTASFGDQWNRYRRTQLDRYNGTTLSHDRFFRDTGWTAEELRGQKVLEAGCGAGRFTEVMLEAGAEVYSADYSSAVDACWANNGPHPSLCLVQADLYDLPFKFEFFDKVFCYGVLQHTPDVKGAFMSLLPYLKAGGKIAVDVYRKMPWTTRWTAKYWYRPLTKRLPRSVIHQILAWYIPWWIPVDNFFQRIPVARQVVPAIVPCWNYSGMLPVSSEQIKIWAILDTFDALTPEYDSPQSKESVQSWFEAAGLSAIDVREGGNGILGNASKA
jgi:SAM-dependent methyltransferase